MLVSMISGPFACGGINSIGGCCIGFNYLGLPKKASNLSYPCGEAAENARAYAVVCILG